MRASTAVAVAAPLASGVLLWASSPSVGIGALAWVALVPAAALAIARPGTRAGRAAVPLALVVALELQLVPAFPFGLAEDQWGDPVLPVMVGDSPVLAIALVLVPLAGLALYAVRFPQPLPLGRPTTPAAALAWTLVPAVSWTALDFLRASFDPGGFWGPLFLSQAGGAGAPLAALGGPWLVTFVLVAAGFALALLAAARPRRIAVAPLALAALLAAAALLPLVERPGGETLRVGAVQPGFDTAELERPVNRHLRAESRDLEQASLDLARDLEPLTRDAARRGAELVVWPEATLWVDPRKAGPVRDELERIAAETGAVVVAPYFLRAESAGAVVAVLPDGRVTPPQRKHRPMWFLGERAAAGAGLRPVDAGPVRLGTLLGVDTQTPAPARRLAGARAELLASSTHDWPALARRQQTLAKLHAAALRLPLVRADWRHGSAIVGGDGRFAADAGSERRRLALVADVALEAPPTPYARLGDVLGWACVAGAGLALAAALAAPLRRERAQAEGAA